jgi:hypothetical protein
MPRKSKKKSSASKRRTRNSPSEMVVAETIVRTPKPVTAEVTEKRVITTEPEVEIRRPATLSQALTQPPVAVVKPRTTVRNVERKTRRVA